ncbi:MAG: BON domain-containing protein [Gammaproteobacteria bacterium]
MLARQLCAAALSAVLLTSAGCAVMRGQESAGEYSSDAAITTRVKSAFASDQTVAATAIGVETMRGTVQLTGFAKSQAEKDRAAKIARDTKGVTGVKNDIVVRP